MSKESAMAMATGNPNAAVNPSLLTPTASAPATPPPVATAAEPAAVVQVAEGDKAVSATEKAGVEAKIVKERLMLKEKQADLDAKLEQARVVLKKAQDFEDKRKADPIQAIKELGFSEEDLFNFLAAAEPVALTPEQKAQAFAKEEIEKFKAELSDKEKKIQVERDNATVSQYKTDIKAAITSGKDEKFEYCAYKGIEAEQQVFAYINQYLKETGELIPMNEAIADIEDYYEQEDIRMSSLKKRQAKAASASPGLAPAPEAAPAPIRTRTLAPGSQSQARPLTNRATPVAASPVPQNETREQKRERIINAVKNGTYGK